MASSLVRISRYPLSALASLRASPGTLASRSPAPRRLAVSYLLRTCYAEAVTDPFLPLSDLPALDAALERSRQEPILIFKHSATCGISAQAHEELIEWHTTHQVAVPTFLVHVRRHREVSDGVAERFGIRHESPQLVLVENGVVRWHGSHWRVNGREVQQALNGITTAAP
jgi:bacillithiol system protein YtxJ